MDILSDPLNSACTHYYNFELSISPIRDKISCDQFRYHSKGFYKKDQQDEDNYRNILINMGIPTASPFCKGGLRGIFLIQPGLIENLPIILSFLFILSKDSWTVTFSSA